VAELLSVSGDLLAPWESIRGDHYFTADVQFAIIRDALAQHGQVGLRPPKLGQSGPQQ
jgi:hypothetical protein